MNAREQKLAIATAVIVGGGLLITQVLEPAVKSWRDLQAQAGVLEDAVQRDRELSAKLPKLVKQRKALSDSLRPPQGTGLIPWFIRHVRSTTEKSGFSPASLRFVSTRPLEERQAKGRAREAAKGPFAELRFELKATTSLQKLQDFLVRLADSKRHVRVVSLALTPPKRGLQLEANMSLVALAPIDALMEERW